MTKTDLGMTGCEGAELVAADAVAVASERAGSSAAGARNANVPHRARAASATGMCVGWCARGLMLQCVGFDQSDDVHFEHEHSLFRAARGRFNVEV